VIGLFCGYNPKKFRPIFKQSYSITILEVGEKQDEIRNKIEVLN
jgi:hypothetical protein